MTMNKIMAKLRKKGKGQYSILGICIFLSQLLVSSFAFMFFSKTVQEFLPEGGDTRKFAWLMLGVTVVGCAVFTSYGANLFYKYKSREFGVFLALGAQKKQLRKNLAGQLAAIIGKYVLLGILASLPVSYLIWKFFQVLIISTNEMKYRLDFPGLVVGFIYGGILALCVLIPGIRFIKRANIMDILNDQRKTEMVKEIKPWTGKLGITLIILGLVLAMAVPPVIVKIFLFSMPSIWNATYLISVVGLYLLMLSAVGQAKRGNQPKKYYKNIISTNLMRFTARQTTKNLCVITLLVFVMLISVFYGLFYFNSAYTSGESLVYDYSMHYPLAEKQITKAEIETLATKHDVEITSYEMTETLELVINYSSRDLEDSGKYIDVAGEKRASFLSASEFSRISGMPVSLNAGEYKTVVQSGYKANIWIEPDCLNEIKFLQPEEVQNTKYKGTVEFNDLSITSVPFTFLISDEDYKNFAAKTDRENREQMVLFNVKDVNTTYKFAEELKNEYIARGTDLSDHISLYDSYEEEVAHKAGESYGYEYKAGLSPDNTQLMADWKYAPSFKVLQKADAMQLVAIFVLLSIYIAIISLTAMAIMTYVRSITIAIDNKQLFDDIHRLGANRAYGERVIKIQLRKIFSYPVVAGSALGFMYAIFMTYFNDMRLDMFEVKMVGTITVLIIAASLFMYGMYQFSFRKMKKICFTF